MLAPSELILNEDGSVYHLHLLPSQIADTIIVVGDPDRVGQVSQYFDFIEFQTQKREFATHTGRIGQKRLSVISSGIGTDNVEILLTELDALVNIDLHKRELKPTLSSLKIIRIGTSGALQEDIPLDSFLTSRYGLGFDTLMQFYDFPQNESEIQFCEKAQQVAGITFRPYLASSGEIWKDSFIDGFFQGITLTCPGFYAPQGRELRLPLPQPNYLDRLKPLQFSDLQITNLEMETAGYYSLCKLLGHEMISLNAIIANRALGTFSSNPTQTVERLIERVIGLLDYW
jgi:uridine phosphorylase